MIDSQLRQLGASPLFQRPPLLKDITRHRQRISPRRHTAVDHGVSADLNNLLLREPVVQRGADVDAELGPTVERDEHPKVDQGTVAELELGTSIAREAHLGNILGPDLAWEVVALRRERAPG